MKKVKLVEKEIIDLYKNDYSVKKISQLYDCSVTPIRRILKENNTLVPYFLSKYSYSEVHPLLDYDLIYNMYTTCDSIKAFANKLGIGLDACRSLIDYHHIKRINTTDRKRLNINIPLDNTDIINRYTSGDIAITTIASDFKTTSKTIRNILINNGINIKSTQELQLSEKARKAYVDYGYCLEIRNISMTLHDFCHNLECSLETGTKVIGMHKIHKYDGTTAWIRNYNLSFFKKFPEYEIINNDCSSKLTMKHIKCSNIFMLQKQSILRYKEIPEQLCPKCSPRLKTSLGEAEIRKFITSLDSGIQLIQNTRSIITPLELDFYIPELNLAIEYCGLYWHSEVYKNNQYHYDKYIKCKEKGIRLITIFEDEWLHKNDIVKAKLRHLLGKSTDRVYARKCDIIQLKYAECTDFMNATHIQGADKSKYYFGLKYADKLVALLSIKHPNVTRGKHGKDIVEISRYCTSIHVVGGFSKLLKYFIKHYCTNLTVKKIISYCDLRWGDGNVYTTTGFNFSHHTGINYWYIERNMRTHRYNFAKHKLIKLYPEKAHLTEREIMSQLNINRIYDCGSNLYYMDI